MIALAIAAAGPTLAGEYGDSANASGQYAADAHGTRVWVDQSAEAAQRVPIQSFQADGAHVPAVIPTYQSFFNSFGFSSTYQPSGPTVTSSNPFFQALGTNGRTCASCHSATAGWSITPPQVQALFYSTLGTDPLFQPVDGSNCSSANVSTFQSRLSAYSLLLKQGLIRIFEKMSAAPQYSINQINDPYACTTSPATGLTSYGPNVVPAGFLSVYRRPLQSADLNVISTILADGRETTLEQQAIDANRIHAQATTPLSPAQATQMVNFETGLFTAQTYSNMIGDLTSNGVTGGPVAFAQVPFYFGINDPFGLNPANTPFNQDVFNLYTAWLPYYSSGSSNYSSYGGFGGFLQYRGQIARGEQVFNETKFTISGVTGLNDTFQVSALTGTCSTCHDTPNGGTHSLATIAPTGENLMMDTGTSQPNPPALNASALPVFTFQCNAGTMPAAAGNNTVISVTDPGRATLSGQCADIGRVKVLTLRNLAQRPPYFHNGTAATLNNVVSFYNTRFNIGLGQQDQAALAAFLATL